jgi:hypothetical protein
MPSDDNERPPQQLLQSVTHYQVVSSQMASALMSTHESVTTKKPGRITFSTRDEEIRYTQKLMDNCATYDGTPEQLIAWLKETDAFIAKENYPDSDHPFIIRHLLVDDALDYYLAHDHLVFNFSDLRELFLHNPQVFASWRTLYSLNALASRETPRYLSSNRQQSTLYNTTLKHQEHPVSSDDLPSPMPTDTLVCAHGESLRPPSDSSSNLLCQWCSAAGHAARECSFLTLELVSPAVVSNSLFSKPSNPFVLDTPTPVDNTPTTARMFPTPLLSSRPLRDDPLSIQQYLQNRVLSAGSVPSRHFRPPCSAFLADGTLQFFFDPTHWMLPTSLLSTSDLRDDPLSVQRYLQNQALAAGSGPSHDAAPPSHNNGCQWSELLQSSPIPQRFPLTLDLDVSKPTGSNVTCPPRSKPLFSSRQLPHGRLHPSHSSHLYHPPDERDDILDEPIFSSLSNHASHYTEVDSVLPDGPTLWPSEPLPPRSRPSLTSHHYHPQHERDYVLAKSISSSLPGGTPMSGLSNQTSHNTAVDSVWPDGPTEWLSEPLPPRVRPYILDNDVVALPEPQCSSLQDPGTRIILPAATDLISPATAPITSCLIGSVCSSTFRRQHFKTSISSPRNYSPVSRLFFLPARPSVRLSFCASLSVFLLLFGFILTSGSFNFSTDSRYAAHELHPGWQIWHVMVP